MIRIVKMMVVGVASLVIVTVASVLLFWLGRSQTTPATEVVFGGEDEDYDDDDLGEDVDE